MARGWVHTIRKDGAWVNEVEGSLGVPWSRDASRDAAVDRGKHLARARASMHVVHGENGEEAERFDYGRGA